MSEHLVDTAKVPAVVQPGMPQHAPSRGSQRTGSVVSGGPTISVPLAAGAIAARVPSAAAPAAVSVAPVAAVDRREVLSKVRRERRDRHRLAALSVMGLVAALGATVLLLDMVH